MTLLVDTCVWSLAFRRDAPPTTPEVQALTVALARAEGVVTTGLVLLELLQGHHGPKAPSALLERLRAVPLLEPELADYQAAAELHNACRRAGIQLSTVDALIAQLCLRHDLTLLTTDHDFRHAAKHCRLRVWSGQA
jgi:predicted nucleic acid-binding protein